MNNEKKFVYCNDCKNMYYCERTYFGGCTDGIEWSEEKMGKDNIEHGWVASNYKEIEPEEIFICSWCGEKIYEGDSYYDINGETVCYDCIDRCEKFA